LKKNEIITVDISENVNLSKSLAYYEGHKILISGGYAGQNADVRIKKMREKRWEATLETVNRPAPEETQPVCPDFGRCGGCRFQDITYEHQLHLKEAYIHTLFEKAKIPYDTFEPILPSPSVWHYRNKMEFSFGDEVKDGPLTLGMHEKGRHHNIVSLQDCKISPTDFSVILRGVETYFRERGTSFYHLYERDGFLRHIVMRHAVGTNELLINLVTTSEKTLDDGFVSMLLGLPLENKIAGILHTVNNSPSDAVKPETVDLLYGRDHLIETCGGLSFRISPFSFFQTNTRGAEVLYSKVKEYAGDASDKVIFDLYCGTGTIAQMVARGAKKVYGIEIVEEAVEAAKENVVRNGIGNCEFICGDVLERVDGLNVKADVIILDPPRAGIHPKAIDKIIAFAPETFVYVSCKATSLINDLPKFLEAGYTVKQVCPVDMFPHTEHVETVVLIARAEMAYVQLNFKI
jgi:23S rRNA (uracil-5-)-methyltransferase RumA